MESAWRRRSSRSASVSACVMGGETPSPQRPPGRPAVRSRAARGFFLSEVPPLGFRLEVCVVLRVRARESPQVREAPGGPYRTQTTVLVATERVRRLTVSVSVITAYGAVPSLAITVAEKSAVSLRTSVGGLSSVPGVPRTAPEHRRWTRGPRRVRRSRTDRGCSESPGCRDCRTAPGRRRC